MKRFVSLFLFFILFNVIFINCAFSDDPCTESMIKIQSIANSFNKTIKSNVGNGTFDVKKIGDGGPNTRFAITYKIDKKKYPQQIAIRDPEVDPYEITSGKFDRLSSLIFYYRFGMSGAVGCGFVIYPHAGQFNVLQLPYPFSIIDPEKDGNDKIVSQEVESWAYECEFLNATYPRWPKIFKLDTKIGKLIDVSSIYPEVYKEKYIEYTPEFKKEINDLLSPVCKNKFFDYLARLKRSSGETKTSSAESPIPEILAIEFENKFRNQNIDKLVNLLGEPTITGNILSELRYTWNYDDIIKMPVRIIIMFKHEGNYYCDEFIANINSSKIITSLWCKSNRLWLTKEEPERKQSIGQISGNDIQQKSKISIDKRSNIPTGEVSKEDLTQAEFESKLKYMSSVDQIFDYLGKPMEYKYNSLDHYFHIRYKWDRIENAPFKIEVIDRNRDHYYAGNLIIILFDRLKEKEELSRLGRKSGSPLHIKNPDFKINNIIYSSYFPIKVAKINSQPVLQNGNTSIKVSVVSEKGFIADYKNRKLSELISSLGEPTEIKKSMGGIIYIWDYDEINKIPIKIINARQNKRDREHYCDSIKAIARGLEGKISNISCDDKKGWITEEEEKRIAMELLEDEKRAAMEVQKQKLEEEKRQAIAKTDDKPLSVMEVLININENTHTSTQISEYRKSTNGKYVAGIGIVTEVKRDPIYVKFNPTGEYNYTLYVSINDKIKSKKGEFHLKVSTQMDMSNVPLWQKIKYKGKFGPSKEGTTGQYVHLYKCEVELLK